MTQPTLISLHSNEYIQELRCIPFAVNFNRCAGSCTTLGNLSSRVCVPNEKQVFNLHVVYMITGINEPKTLTNIYHAGVNVNSIIKNVTQIKNVMTINVAVSVKIQKNIMCAKKGYIWNPATWSC